MKRVGWLALAALVVVALVSGGYFLLSPRLPASEEPDDIVSGTGSEGAIVPESPRTQAIVILHTNDFHGAVEPQVKGGGGRGEVGRG